MKIILVLIVLLILNNCVFAQKGLILNSYMFLSEGAHLKANGTDGNLTVKSNGGLFNDGSVTIEGYLLNDGRRNTNNILTGDLGSLILSSSKHGQYIGGTKETEVERIYVDNSHADELTLNNHLVILNSMYFMQGHVLTSSSALVKFSSSASYSGATDNAHIEGPARKTGSTDFHFPIGKDNRLLPISILSLTGSDTFTAEYMNEAFYNLHTGDNLDHVAWFWYWVLENTGSETSVVRLSWDEFSEVWNGFEGDLCVAQYKSDGTSLFWDNMGKNNLTGDFTGGTLDSDAGIDNYWLFTLGSTSVNALPVELLNYKIVCTKTGSVLEWTTASESNNGYFTIEKSTDMKEWRIVSTVEGALYSNVEMNYRQEDDNIQNGELTYYRLKQTDTDGAFVYFDVLSALCKFPNDNLDLIGVNASDNMLNIIVTTNGMDLLNIDLLDLSGRQLLSNYQHQTIPGANIINLPIQYSSGVYIVMLKQNEKQVSKKIYLK